MNTYMTHAAKYIIPSININGMMQELSTEYKKLKQEYKLEINGIELPTGYTIKGPIKIQGNIETKKMINIQFSPSGLELVINKQSASLIPLKQFHEIGQKYMKTN